MAKTNSNKIFDRETLLDLTVNFIPLFIILFFLVLFLLIQPWGGGLFPMALMLGLLVVPFVGLAVLTYFSGKAIAGAEKSSTVYYPGQAGMPNAEVTHGESEDDEEPQALDSGSEHDGELTDGEKTDTETADADAAGTTNADADEANTGSDEAETADETAAETTAEDES